MNKSQRQVFKKQLEEEKKTIKDLEESYQEALKKVEDNINYNLIFRYTLMN